MKIKFSKEFLKQYKKADIRIRQRVDEKLLIFEKNPMDISLKNHPLHGIYLGDRSIDITSDWRAIYKELPEVEKTESIAYFTTLGTHNQLYRK